MVNTLTIFGFNKTNKPVSRKINKSNRKLKGKQQASKTQPREAVELEWLKQFMNAKVVVVLLIFVALFNIPLILPNEDILPIDKIRISGDYKKIDMKKIDQNLDSYLGKGFFSVDIKSIQKSIRLEPWIRTVSVKRIWPSQLQVHLTKKNAVARWDNEHLLSQQAKIFKADSNQFLHLPRLNGYPDQSKELLQRYSQLQQEFSNHGILIAEMIEDKKGALSLVLNKNLIVKIGSENNDMKIKHLLAVYPHQIKPRVEQIKHIDFRYSNGFSIAWKDEFLEQSGDTMQRGSKNV